MTQTSTNHPVLSPQDTIGKVSLLDEGVKWSWCCRILEPAAYRVESDSAPPTVGDVVVARIVRVGHHGSIVGANNKKLRLYVDDVIVGVFGNRYATDALEAEVEDVNNISLLTSAGMIGTVISKHEDFGKTTDLSFVGFLSDSEGERVNLKRRKPFQSSSDPSIENLIILIGTGMNSGKTTCAGKLTKELGRRGYQVGACKLTGSVSNRDQDEMRSAYAVATADFSDYGFPSTYLSTRDELLRLFYEMLFDLAKANPDLVLMEMADGILQRETSMLLSDPGIRGMVKGVVVIADSAPAALYAVENLVKLGYNVAAVSGKITSSPLYMREFETTCDVKIGSSTGSGKELADVVASFLWPSAKK